MYKSDNGKFKEGIIWWDTKKDPNIDVDIFFYIHDYDKRAEFSYGFKTLEIDLNQTEEAIFSQYNSSLRRQLRKINQYDFDIKFYTSLSDQQIIEYVDIYNKFAKFKNLQETSVKLISQMNKERKLIISRMFQGNTLVNIHSHYVANGRARLYQSFSTDNSLDSKTKGLANKFLTHKDILYFKNSNFNIYDFGGIGNVTGDNTRFEGIIRFKKQFGGKEVILWKGVTPNGQRGIKIYKKYFK